MLWDAELIRVSFFWSATGASGSHRYSLSELIGKPLDEISERPQQGFRHEVARFGEDNIFLTQQPGRADLILGKVPAPESPMDLVSIGPYDHVKSSFLDVARRLAASSGDYTRLAYGPNLLMRASDHVSAYKTLSKMLPNVKIDGEKSSDLFWQINRPRLSKVLQPAKINRFMRWSVVQLQTLTITPGQIGVLSASLGVVAVKLDMDISTPAEGVPLSRTVLLDSFDELISLADEIAEKGDVA